MGQLLLTPHGLTVSGLFSGFEGRWAGGVVCGAVSMVVAFVAKRSVLPFHFCNP